MPRDRLLTSIKQGRLVIGCAHMIRDEAVTETLRNVEVDFLLIDMQHMAIGIESLQRVLVALQPTDVAVLVRVPSNDPVVIGQVLDVGAAGIIVPMVNDSDDGKAAVAAALYPPQGIRSWGPRRVSSFHGDPMGYAKEANSSTVIIAQIETQEAVDNLDSILSVDGLSGLMIGPADLAISMGYMLDRDNEAVMSAIESVFSSCKERDMPCGIFTNNVERALHWIERGAAIVNCSSDATFVIEGYNRVARAIAEA